MRDTVPLTLSIITAEGLPASDSRVSYTFCDRSGSQIGDPIIEPLRGLRVFNLDPAAGDGTLSCGVSCDHFRDMNTGFFFVSPGNPVARSLVALREPGKWTPVFRPLAALTGPAFEPLQKVVSASDAVDLKNGPTLGPLAQAFDTLTGNAQILAKMALLNLYAMLSSERSPIRPFTEQAWFSFVQKIVRIDQERFVSVVTKPVFDSVQHILARQDYFSGLRFFPEISPGLHTANFPAAYGITGNGDVITVKKHCEEGNLQLTVAVSTPGGQPPIYLLDCDMDEHANSILSPAERIPLTCTRSSRLRIRRRS